MTSQSASVNTSAHSATVYIGYNIRETKSDIYLCYKTCADVCTDRYYYNIKPCIEDTGGNIDESTDVG